MMWHDKLLKNFVRSRGFMTMVDLFADEDIPARFILFDTKSHLQRATKNKNQQVIGTYYKPSRVEEFMECLGVVCLCVDYIGAGIFNHELFHMAEHLQEQGWESEKIADTIQDITNRFWWWFKRMFEERE